MDTETTTLELPALPDTPPPTDEWVDGERTIMVAEDPNQEYFISLPDGTQVKRPPATAEFLQATAENTRRLLQDEARRVVPQAIIGHEDLREKLRDLNLPSAGTTRDVVYDAESGELKWHYRVPKEVDAWIRGGAFPTVSPEIWENYQGAGPSLRAVSMLGTEQPVQKGQFGFWDPVHWYPEVSKNSERAAAAKAAGLQVLRFSEKGTVMLRYADDAMADDQGGDAGSDADTAKATETAPNPLELVKERLTEAQLASGETTEEFMLQDIAAIAGLEVSAVEAILRGEQGADESTLTAVLDAAAVVLGIPKSKLGLKESSEPPTDDPADGGEGDAGGEDEETRKMSEKATLNARIQKLEADKRKLEARARAAERAREESVQKFSEVEARQSALEQRALKADTDAYVADLEKRGLVAGARASKLRDFLSTHTLARFSERGASTPDQVLDGLKSILPDLLEPGKLAMGSDSPTREALDGSDLVTKWSEKQTAWEQDQRFGKPAGVQLQHHLIPAGLLDPRDREQVRQFSEFATAQKLEIDREDQILAKTLREIGADE